MKDLNSSFFNIASYYTVGGDAAKGWKTDSKTLITSCGSTQLSTIKTGVKNIKGPNDKCLSAWDKAPECTHSYNKDGKIMSACSFSRPFNFVGANTIAVG